MAQNVTDLERKMAVVEQQAESLQWQLTTVTNNLDVLQDGTNAQHRYLMSLQQALDQTKDQAAGISNNYLFF